MLVSFIFGLCFGSSALRFVGSFTSSCQLLSSVNGYSGASTSFYVVLVTLSGSPAHSCGYTFSG